MLQQMYPSVAHDYSYELNKDFNFSAAHFIPCEDAGKCQRVHGHTYFVNLTIVGETLDHMGFLANFSELKAIIHDRFDHYLLNELTPFDVRVPSTELVAQTIYEIVQADLDQRPNKPKCIQVFLRETPTSYVVYRPKEQKNG